MDTDTCHLMCPLASILAEPSLLSDPLRVLRYAIPSPCGDVDASKGAEDVLNNGREPFKSSSNALEFIWGT